MPFGDKNLELEPSAAETLSHRLFVIDSAVAALESLQILKQQAEPPTLSELEKLAQLRREQDESLSVAEHAKGQQARMVELARRNITNSTDFDNQQQRNAA